MSKKSVKVMEPMLKIQHDKHHLQELFVLADGEFIIVPKQARYEEVKRVGPAIVDVDRHGNSRKITTHPINGKAIWLVLSNYVAAGVWALSNKQAAAFMPPEMIAKSVRFGGITPEQQKRIKSVATKSRRK